MKLTSTMLTTLHIISEVGKTTNYGYAVNPRRNLRANTVKALIQRGLLENSGETLRVGVAFDGNLPGHCVPLYQLSNAGKKTLAEGEVQA